MPWSMETELAPDICHIKVVEAPSVITGGLASKVTIMGVIDMQLAPMIRNTKSNAKSNGRIFFMVLPPDFYSACSTIPSFRLDGLFILGGRA